MLFFCAGFLHVIRPCYALQHAQAKMHAQVLAAELLNARATPQLRSVADMCLQARPAWQARLCLLNESCWKLVELWEDQASVGGQQQQR